MAAGTGASLDPSLLEAWHREYRLSLVLVLAGIVLLAGSLVWSVSSISPGSHSPSVWGTLALGVSETAGGALVLLGGTVAYYHWRGLQQVRHRD